ncbi:SDR family NAD(P)-dependent oxidoreductase [Arthrobacter sp. NEB 688]|uniref:SDR family NAD(P)-dependent oxidoreductase n=1 Tax=Arthrobacter sp. NEB 688 TaxID=904039 RepID=UPI001566AC46|nr:SDR family NAD(P)-dependent oxidoreductase [Arthrobacter sp. NEB 688]QKE82861.1 SDR family NAD(P)-dependent oxidoreductase [Arthrobacter sp. NEB 688]
MEAAARFAGRGDKVALLSRTPIAVDELVTALRRSGAHAMGVVVDTSDPDAVESAVARVEVELGPVDVWVNTADDPPERTFRDHEPREFRAITEQLYLGHVHATMTVLERMRERGSGTIVHVATAAARRGRAGQSARSGAEAALRGFHESVSAELRVEGSPVRLALVERGERETTASAAAAVLRAAGPSPRARTTLAGALAATATAALLAVRRRRR